MKFSINGEKKAIDEFMIPYNGTNDNRQRINNTSRSKWGYKIWVLAETYDCVVQLLVVQGAEKEKQVTSFILMMIRRKRCFVTVKCLPLIISLHIRIENYFTSFRLLTHLGVNNV